MFKAYDGARLSSQDACKQQVHGIVIDAIVKRLSGFYVFSMVLPIMGRASVL